MIGNAFATLSSCWCECGRTGKRILEEPRRLVLGWQLFWHHIILLLEVRRTSWMSILPTHQTSVSEIVKLGGINQPSYVLHFFRCWVLYILLSDRPSPLATRQIYCRIMAKIRMCNSKSHGRCGVLVPHKRNNTIIAL